MIWARLTAFVLLLCGVGALSLSQAQTVRQAVNSIVATTCAANQWANVISATGAATCAQPGAANLSDGVTGTGAVVRAVAPSLTGVLAVGSTSPGAARLGQKLDLATSANYGGMALSVWTATAGETALFDFNRSKSATIGTQSTVALNDNLGSIIFRGSDGTNFIAAATINGIVDGTVATNQVPGRIVFQTANSSGTLGEKLRVDAIGVYMIALTVAAGTPNSICQNNATKEITVNAALTCTVSSLRFKHDFAPLGEALPAVMAMRPGSFVYNDTDRPRIGFASEYMADVDRRLADGFDADGNPNSIDQNAILAVVVKALQELKAENDNLREEIRRTIRKD